MSKPDTDTNRKLGKLYLTIHRGVMKLVNERSGDKEKLMQFLVRANVVLNPATDSPSFAGDLVKD